MKIHSGKYVRRWSDRAGVWLAVQTPGGVIAVKVREQHWDEAYRICDTVRYAYRGGRPFYLSHDEVMAKEWA